jgi:DNA-binding CsgD family transcriptional regulator
LVIFNFKDQNGVFDSQNSQNNEDSSRENGHKSSAFTTKPHEKPRKKAEYRKIKTYYKSHKRYQKERKRRKKALELSEQGLTYKAIAKQLGISERTVKRDIAKIKPYYERKLKNLYRRLQPEKRAYFESKTKEKTLRQKKAILEYEVAKQKRQREGQDYRCSKLVLVIDLDKCKNGIPSIFFDPKPPFSVQMPFSLIVGFIKDGKPEGSCSLKIG